MSNKEINLLEKRIRAEVIKKYMERTGKKKAVCFTCGNAAKSLRETGVETLAIGEKEELKPGHWFTQIEIKNTFPEHFNATSGDIPIFLMEEIARRMRIAIGEEPPREIRIGSGETAVVMALAYPGKINEFVLVRDGGEETEYNKKATLNRLVEVIYRRRIENAFTFKKR